MTCTTPELVAVELRAASEFSATTIPSLSTITEWISQTSDYVSGISGKNYSVSEKIDYFNYTGEGILFLKNTPLDSFTTLEYNSASVTEAPSWVVLTENTHYVIDVSKGAITLFTSQFSSGVKNGVNRFRATYDAGYSVVPGNVQMLCTKLVANRALESLINQNIDTRADGGSISVGDIRIVEPANYGVGSYKQLKQDINDLTHVVAGGFRVYRYG